MVKPYSRATVVWLRGIVLPCSYGAVMRVASRVVLACLESFVSEPGEGSVESVGN